MKTLIRISFCSLIIILSGIQIIAQSQNIQNLKSDNIFIETDYLDIKIETWEKDYIELKSDVKINLGRNDDSHNLTVSNTNNRVEIISEIDTEEIDKMVIVTDNDGNKTYTPMENWDENMKGKVFGSMNFGYEIDGEITLYIPKNMNTEISSTYGDVYLNGTYRSIETHSTYGLVEAKLQQINNMKQVSIKSTYDVVDLSLDKNSDAILNLHTSYGSVYTDLPLQTNQKSNSKHNHGCGHHSEKYVLNDGSVGIDLVATYDNIYVRSF